MMTKLKQLKAATFKLLSEKIIYAELNEFLEINKLIKELRKGQNGERKRKNSSENAQDLAFKFGCLSG